MRLLHDIIQAVIIICQLISEIDRKYYFLKKYSHPCKRNKEKFQIWRRKKNQQENFNLFFHELNQAIKSISLCSKSRLERLFCSHHLWGYNNQLILHSIVHTCIVHIRLCLNVWERVCSLFSTVLCMYHVRCKWWS